MTKDERPKTRGDWRVCAHRGLGTFARAGNCRALPRTETTFDADRAIVGAGAAHLLGMAAVQLARQFSLAIEGGDDVFGARILGLVRFVHCALYNPGVHLWPWASGTDKMQPVRHAWTLHWPCPIDGIAPRETIRKDNAVRVLPIRDGKIHMIAIRVKLNGASTWIQSRADAHDG